jgi:DNA (cytosine-5)-methyltransferase 1
MRYGSVCSGIEAPTVAWHSLGWRPAFFSEIAAFPSRVLAHHYPEVPNYGDFTKIEGEQCAGIDLLVGGTPCQDFSVAGLRAGMAGERGALSLEFLRLADRARPRWLVWENVPGVLSSDGGRALGAFLGGLAELGYGFAWRVLDAQYFGLAQRRKRVFVVGCAGGQWQRAAAVLLERASLRGDPAPSREEGSRVAGCLEARARSGGYDPGAHGAAMGHLVAGALSRRNADTGGGSRAGGTEMLVPFDTTQITSRENRSRPEPGDPAPAIAFHATQDPISGDVAPASGTEPTGSIGVLHGAAVRRLTPRECERLMGFPDDYTAIPGAKDGPRYAALGNSIAVNVLRWIGERIERVNALSESEAAA